MHERAKRGWSIPAVLAVQVLALGCPDDDGDDDGATVASATEAAESSDTGEPVDCAALMGTECDAHPRCAIDPDIGQCGLDCTVLDEADCNAVPRCEWLGDGCDYGPLA